ncbi:MAG: hypothetical protein OHK0021_09400 [Bryobacter sp.]
MKQLVFIFATISAFAQSVPQNLEWRQLPANNGPQPSARFDGTIAVDTRNNHLYLFGGTDATGDVNDLWRYDLASRQWSAISPAGALPPARHGHTLNYDPASHRLFVIAGQARSFFGDVWAYDIAANRWTELARSGAGPSSRYSHSTVLDAKRNRLVFSHGFTSDRGRFDDTWAFDLATNQWSDITPSGSKPLRRCLHHAVINPARDEMYLYGGCSSGAGACPQADLWVLDLTRNTWREVGLNPRPAGRQWYGISWDEARSRIVIFGGSGFGSLGDAWEYDPAANRWEMLIAANQNPSARHRVQGAYSPMAGNLFFGGIVNGLTNDLWQLAAPPPPLVPSIAAGGLLGVFGGEAGPFAPNEIVSLYGSNFDAATIEIEGTRAQLFFSSPNQINLLLPASLAGRSTATLQLRNAGGATASYTLNLVPAAPKFHPALIRVEDILIVYGTGAGQNFTGALATLNGAPAELLYAGPAPGFVGLEQYNVRIPTSERNATDYRFRLTLGNASGEIQLAPQ